MDLSTISVFLRVVDQKGLSSAAARLGMTTSGVSRALTRLEAEVGTLLVERTTRRIALTEDGAEFYRRCKKILVEMEEAVAAVNTKRTRPIGRVRLQCPVGFGKHAVIPKLPQLLVRYPDLVIDLQLEDRHYDLASESIDVAVRVGKVKEPGLVARKLCRTQFITCASPAYLATFGCPQTPADLSKHRCIGYFNPQTKRYRSWGYVEDSVERWQEVYGSLNVNTADGLLDAALNGCGIATLTTFVAAEPIARGSLQVVLGNFATRGPDVWVLYPPSRRMSLPVRVVVDFLVSIARPALAVR